MPIIETPTPTPTPTPTVTPTPAATPTQAPNTQPESELGWLKFIGEMFNLSFTMSLVVFLSAIFVILLVLLILAYCICSRCCSPAQPVLIINGEQKKAADILNKPPEFVYEDPLQKIFNRNVGPGNGSNGNMKGAGSNGNLTQDMTYGSTNYSMNPTNMMTAGNTYGNGVYGSSTHGQPPGMYQASF